MPPENYFYITSQRLRLAWATGEDRSDRLPLGLEPLWGPVTGGASQDVSSKSTCGSHNWSRGWETERPRKGGRGLSKVVSDIPRKRRVVQGEAKGIKDIIQ